MELMIEAHPQRERFEMGDEDKEFRPVEIWTGVICNDDMEITGIRWYVTFSEPGPIALEWIPRTVTSFMATRCRITGTVDLTSLPSGMETSFIGNNNLTGSLDLTALPSQMRALACNNNQFRGSIILTRLPASLDKLMLYSNALSGSLDFGATEAQGGLLPQALKFLFLQKNKFVGALRVPELSATVQSIDVTGNAITEVFWADGCQDERVGWDGM